MQHVGCSDLQIVSGRHHHIDVVSGLEEADHGCDQVCVHASIDSTFIFWRRSIIVGWRTFQQLPFRLLGLSSHKDFHTFSQVGPTTLSSNIAGKFAAGTRMMCELWETRRVWLRGRRRRQAVGIKGCHRTNAIVRAQLCVVV